MDVKISKRFFTGVLIITALLLLFIGIHDYHAQQAFDGLRERYFILFILVLLPLLGLLRITREAKDALVESNRRLDELNKTLDQKVQERTRDLQKVQNQLLQSEKFSAIGQLASGIAHEINNPLGFINSNLETLQKYVVHYTQLLGLMIKLEKALKSKNQQRAYEAAASCEKILEEVNFPFIDRDIHNLLSESREGVETIRKIVADLRTFACPDKGTEDYVDLESLLESMLNIAWNEIKYKAQVKKEYGHVPEVYCNPQKIGQVFVNLLTNAAHAIETKGVITVKTYTKDGFVCVEIVDTGCGIPPENTYKIFDPFFSTRPVGQGVGLGLSTSYDIVRRYGGVITFSSRVDHGTSFIVMLPMEFANVPQQACGGCI